MSGDEDMDAWGRTGPANSCRVVAAVPAALLVLLALLAPVPQARAEDPRVDRIEIVAAGFYDATSTKIVGATAAPAAAASKTNQLGDVVLMSDPPATTARAGIGFGVRFRTSGEPRGARATLRSVWKIPPPGIHNPNNDNTYRQSVVDFTTVIGGVHWRGYGFDEPWEVVPGEWTLEIWQGDRKLLEKSFAIK
jgi:hypothetical protein